MEQFFIDSALCNFADKKTGYPVLVGAAEVKKLYDQCKKLSCDWQKVRTWKRSRDINFSKLNESLKDNYVGELLTIGQGHLVLAGGSIRTILIGGANGTYDYDIFFYNLDVSSAEKLLNDCLNYIDVKYVIGYIERSQYVITVYFADGVVQFIKRIYQSKNQVLLGFDIAGAKLLWDHDGFRCTIDAAVAIACNGFVLDFTQKSASFEHRLVKYNNEKNYDIYLPNIKKIVGSKLEIGNLKIDFNRPTPKIDSATSDYVGNNYGFSNCLHIANNMDYYVKFGGKKLFEMRNLTDEVVRSSVLSDSLANMNRFDDTVKSSRLSFPAVQKFLGDADYLKFINAYCIKHDKKAAKEIWKNVVGRYINAAKKIAEYINDPVNSWKIDDPASQYFGKFNPLKISTREWIGDENYIPFIVGLSNDRVVMFRLCYSRYAEIPPDIDNLLLMYWFWAEVCDARNRLGIVVH